MSNQTRTGADRLLDDPERFLPSGPIGLVTNHTGRTAAGQPLAQAMLERGVQLTRLFGPEHGLTGQITAGEKIVSGHDPLTGLPFYSLYGDTERPTPEMLAPLEAILFDIQDIGARFYTYASTMLEVLYACAEAGKPLIILDRPNPITGLYVSGTLLDLRFRSFIGCAETATRFGMTIGELARFFQARYCPNAELRVVELSGWKRSQWQDETGLPWVAPSPNIPNLETALVYIGTCAFEGTNLSEGRGTPSPFLTIGAPWIRGADLAAAMHTLIRQRDLPGVTCEPASFTPSSSKNAGMVCEGVTTIVTDRDAFEPFQWGLYLLSEVKQRYPDQFAWRAPSRPGTHYHIDLLMGTDWVRLQLDAGADVEQILASEAPRLAEFKQLRQNYLLYE